MADGVICLLLEMVAEELRSRVWSKVDAETSKIGKVKVELQKLDNQLRLIQPILRDAHTKLFVSKEIKRWILRLNAIAYDAHDAIDLYRVIIQRCSTNHADTQPQSKVRKILNFFSRETQRYSLLWELGGKVKEINERLNLLYKEKDYYGLQPLMEGSGLGNRVVGEMWQGRQTTGNIIKSKIVGRERDEEFLVEWLVKEPDESEENVCVASIVGMGGMGKTTLAKSIYNNSSVAKSFDRFMWVCVSERPCLLNLLKKILEEVDKNEQCPASQLIGCNSLSSRLREHLKGKKFLLVLDDIWDCEWWNELKGLWRGAGSGCKVLVTTRDMGVVRAIKSDHWHQLEGLNHELSWQLFVNEALRKGEIEQDLSVVREIGLGIVRKCSGLPLALSTAGAMMRQKDRRASVWQDILKSPVWSWKGPRDQNDIFSVLALSYMNIPFPLKQCLTYCSLFPKDFEIYKERLLRLWMAEGFIGEEEGMDMEGLAEKYLEELVLCNLIQVAIKKDSIYEQYYVLHDMVHDLALYIRGEEHITTNILKCDERYDRVRFRALVREECFENFPAQKVRSLVSHGIRSFSCSSFVALKWLRVLDLRKANISRLSESISELVLLRYLNLSETKIAELPETIVQLHDLQTLDLRGSRVRRLPEKLSCFPLMRHLDLQETSLEYLPEEIGKLTKLRTLWKFVIGSNNEIDVGKGSSLIELHDLNNLRGFLIIEHLERVVSKEECQYAQLQKKENLERLEFSWGEEDAITGFEDLAKKMNKKYKELRPPSNIPQIDITNYPGRKLPRWMHDSFHCLEKVGLRNCKFLEHLPNFGYLPKLKVLSITGADRVKVLDTTFVVHNGVGAQFGFPKLEKFYLSGLDSLDEWRFDVAMEKETMPCLRRLVVQHCPKLRTLPIFPTLEELRLGGMDSFEGWEKGSSREWPCLKQVTVLGPCPNLKFLPHGPVLEYLYIKGCDELVELPFSATLTSVSIRDCKKVVDPSSATLQILENLEIINSPNLVPSTVKRIPNMKQLGSLRIQGCSNLISFPDVLQLPRLEKLVLRDLPHLESISSPATKMSNHVRGLEELQLGPNIDSSILGLQGFIFKHVAEISRLRQLALADFHGLEMLQCFPSMRDLEKLGVCTKLVGSVVDILARNPMPKLRGFCVGKALFSHHFEHFHPHRKMLTCSLTIDSLETSNILNRLTQLSKKIDALEIKMLPGHLDSLPDWMQHLHQLQYLEVGYSKNLARFPDWVKNFTKLESLTLSHLPELSSLPEELGKLHQLEELKIYHCPKLSFLPSWVQKLPKLQKLTIWSCPDLVNRCYKEDRHKISHIHNIELFH